MNPADSTVAAFLGFWACMFAAVALLIAGRLVVRILRATHVIDRSPTCGHPIDCKDVR